MSSAFDRPGGQPDVPDTPAEVSAGERRAPERSDTWLNLDNESDEKLLSFLGLDRPGSGKADAPPERADSVGEAGKPDDPLRRQQALGKEIAEGIEKEIDRKIDKTVDDLNPKFDRTKTPYRENCTGVVQAYELQRRDLDVQPGPLEKHLRSDEGGFGGRSVAVIEQAWGRGFTPGTRADIESAFSEPGSRGVVYIQWNRRGAHVFNVENVGGNVRFVDGQPTPGMTDASHYFNLGHSTQYLRLDDLPTPSDARVRPYLEPSSIGMT